MAAKETKRREVSPAAIVIALAVLAGIALFTWLTFGTQPHPPSKPVLTAEAKAYLPNLKLTEVQPQTSESYIQKSLFEIIGKITNAGPRSISAVQVVCVFRNFNNREIKRELVSVVAPRNGVLAPNATRPFRLAFDDVPDDWNHQMPDFVIAQIGFK